eukprot:1143632-Pelagomonas_calceolata.AAC.3
MSISRKVEYLEKSTFILFSIRNQRLRSKPVDSSQRTARTGEAGAAKCERGKWVHAHNAGSTDECRSARRAALLIIHTYVEQVKGRPTLIAAVSVLMACVAFYMSEAQGK